MTDTRFKTAWIADAMEHAGLTKAEAIRAWFMQDYA